MPAISGHVSHCVQENVWKHSGPDLSYAQSLCSFRGLEKGEGTCEIERVRRGKTRRQEVDYWPLWETPGARLRSQMWEMPRESSLLSISTLCVGSIPSSMQDMRNQAKKIA